MSVVIDDISLQIEYTTGDVAKNIDALTESLGKLNRKLSQSGVVKLNRNMMSLNACLKQIDSEAVSNIERLSNALSGLGNVKVSGSFWKSISKVGSMTGSDGGDALGSTDILSSGLTESVDEAEGVANATKEITKEMVTSADKVQVLKWKLEEAKKSLDKLYENKDSSFSSIVNQQDKVIALQDRIEKLTNPIKKVSDNSKEASKSVDKLNKSLKKMGSSTKSATSGLGKLLSSLKRVMFYRIIRTVIKEIGDAFKEGVNNIARYSDAIKGLDTWNVNGSMSKMASSILYLKNALGTLVAPILQAVAPALEVLVNGIVKVINVINQLIASIKGLSTFTKAVYVPKNYAESLDKANKSAKKLKDNLQSFDELNVIRSQDNSSSGTEDYSGMFEEVPIDTKLGELGSKLREWLDKLKEWLDKLKGWFLDGWNSVWDKLNLSERLAKLKDYINKIKELLAEIWNDPRVQEAFEKFMQSLAYNLGRICASMFSIGVSMAEFLLGGFAQFLEQHKEDIKQHLIDMFNIWAEINTLFGDFFESLALIFTAFGSQSGINFSSALFSILWEMYENVTLLFSKLFRDILRIFVQPLSDNAEGLEKDLEDILQYCADVSQSFADMLDDIGKDMQSAYDEHIAPFFEDIANDLSDTVSKFNETWNSDIKPILDESSKMLTDMLNNSIKPFFQSTIETMKPLVDDIRILWNVVLKPLLDFCVTGFFPVLSALWLKLQATIVGGVQIVSNILQDHQGKLQILFNFIKDIFTVGIIDAVKNLWENWKTHTDNMGQKWEDTWNGMEETFQRVDGILVDAVTNLGKKIVQLFSDIKQAFIDMKSTFSSGVSIGVTKTVTTTSTSTTGTVKTRASGGTISSGEMFIARENGIPELVGKFGNQNGVANNEQIIGGIRSGVESAIVSVVAPYLNSLVDSNNAIASKEFGITDDAISKSVRRSAESYYKQNGTDMYSFA